ncbi:trypsin-like peptidase domain-containing protein [Thiorhodococcus mannitoliphagus]|uniref:Serine protease n=1 Tax=Thiorhodococcus mannitoliphagus TaxID=329406 RepID=A0A6P1E0L2_9GAMM|nr:serine protease [Thiorhodococcus mannitoliphagus]NEX23449.1 trypsin-like peptidase domain-containing protein [Thiorhodococcus mannitoliphagus]
MRLLNSFVGLSLLLGWALFAATTGSAAGAGRLINCHEKNRGLVTRTRPDACEGRVVSDAEAASIRQRRQDYVKESLGVNVSPSVLGKRMAGVGAGFFVDDKGTILTNAHIVKGCSTITVSPPGQKSSPARLEEISLALDLALLKTNLRSRRHAVFAPADHRVSGEVAIIGYPSQGSPQQTPILTKGTLPDTGSRPTAARPLPLKVAVRPGNSGGPVLDASGRVIGVVFAAIDTKRVYQQTGQLARDIGMAIPNGISLPFMTRNGIQPTLADSPKASPDLLKEAKRYLARVECWL